jgi:glycosyltransferase involved in cell wall biosynthesis
VARDCTIHFLNRIWAWRDGVLDLVHPSNRLIGVWWHGRLDSPDPGMQAALERLRALHGRFARLHVTCASGRRTLEAIGVPEEKIVTLPIGVDLETFRPVLHDQARLAARRALDVRDGSTVIGCFQKDGSGWNDDAEPKLIKGPDVFADTVIRLHASYPIHVVIPGPSRGYVKRRLANAGVPFAAPGRVPRHQLPGLYHALDLYLSPSRDEGGPAGALEAMASGVAVVSSKTGMPADVIQSGVNGILVEVGDAEALGSAAAELIEDPARRRSLAGAALSTIQAYDWRVLAARYAAELYAPLSHARSRNP